MPCIETQPYHPQEFRASIRHLSVDPAARDILHVLGSGAQARILSKAANVIVHVRGTQKVFLRNATLPVDPSIQPMDSLMIDIAAVWDHCTSLVQKDTDTAVQAGLAVGALVAVAALAVIATALVSPSS